MAGHGLRSHYHGLKLWNRELEKKLREGPDMGKTRGD